MSSLLKSQFGGGIGTGIGGVLGSLVGKNESTTTDLDQLVKAIGDSFSSSEGSGTQAQNQTSISNPNNPDWYNSFLSQLIPQYNSLYSKAMQPLIGQQQKVQGMQSINSTADSATQRALSQLAKVGGLNSGRSASVISDLGLGRIAEMNKYLSSIPTTNAQWSMQNGTGLLGAGMGFKPNFGQTTQTFGGTSYNTNQNQNSNFNQTTDTDSTQRSKTKSGLFGKAG